jgi:hypothetical protein
MRLFEGARKEHLAIGEASTTYLFSREAMPAIEERLSESRYIAMLRTPVEMAPALHEQEIRVFHEDVKSFSEAWALWRERREGKAAPRRWRDPIKLDYQSWCRLGEQMACLYESVSTEQVLPLVLDDIRENVALEYRRVPDFLGVPDVGRGVFPIHNFAGGWRSGRIGRLVRRMGLSASWAKHIARIFPKRSLGLVEFSRRLASGHARIF